MEEFIKANYGSGCVVGDKKPWKQDGVYEIIIKGEQEERDEAGINLATAKCPIAWRTAYKVLYDPKENKIISVNLGQECTFGTNPHSSPYQCFDESIINSIKFE